MLFDQLPEKLDPASFKHSSKKRPAPPGGKTGPIPMFPSGRQSSVSSQRAEELARARSGGRPTPVFGTPNSRGSVDTISHIEPRFTDPSFNTSMGEPLGIDMSSRATSGSPSTASSSQHHPGYSMPPQQQHNSHNPVQKLDTLMFPSEDPFAYPNQPMMELSYQPPVTMSSQGQAQNSQFFMPGSFEEVDSQLLGQPPPYVIQHPEGQPGLEFSANMYDPNLFGVQMGQQPHHPPPPSSSSSQQMHHPAYAHSRRPQPRRQQRQIDQMFTENGMQADWGSFFGSGRGVFQGM